METSILIEYGWTFLIIIGLEGLLAADNAMVMAVLVRHLPVEQQKKALFYGLAGAFVFRFGSLFAISFLVNVWQVQALGAIYLLYLGLNHIFRTLSLNNNNSGSSKKPKKQSGFWMTVLKVEIADIAFAVDSILAAVALAVVLPEIKGIPDIGGMHGSHFIVIFSAGLIGVVLIRFAAGYFIKLLNYKPGLELAAYGVVTWVGVKLSIYTLGHESLQIIDPGFAHSTLWKVIFWSVMIVIILLGWFLGGSKETKKSIE